MAREVYRADCGHFVLAKDSKDSPYFTTERVVVHTADNARHENREARVVLCAQCIKNLREG